MIRTEGATLVAYATPGHTPEHMSFWHQEERCLFSGDHVLGWGTTMMWDLYDYMKTLQLMIDLAPVHLFPGHGPMILEGVPLLERYIKHRRAREEQVGGELLSWPSPTTPFEIAARIYTDTSKERLWMATDNVQKILLNFDKSGEGVTFLRQPDGALEPYRVPEDLYYLKTLPPNLVWVHRSNLGRVRPIAGGKDRSRLYYSERALTPREMMNGDFREAKL